MAVTADQLITRRDGEIGQLPVITSVTLYGGTMAFVDATTGYGTNVTGSGANKFAGVVRDKADNSSGASGAIDANVYERGTFTLVGSGFTQADNGKKVYASDNFTVTTTSTSNSLVGTIVNVISATKVEVAIDVQKA